MSSMTLIASRTAPGVVEHRRRLDARPAVVAAAPRDPVAHGHRRRPLAEQRAPAREHARGERLAVLAEHLEARRGAPPGDAASISSALASPSSRTAASFA